MIGDSITSALYQKALDGVWQRQKAISNNIANSETPGYKAQKVNFEDSLNAAMKSLKAKAKTSSATNQTQDIQTIENSKIDVYSADSTSNRLDENNVDLESENIDMSKTVMQYYYLTRGVSDSYSRLKYAIKGGS